MLPFPPLPRSATTPLWSSLALLLGLLLQPSHAAPTSLQDAEGLIIAVDVSRTMRQQLPEVRRSIQTLVRGLDRQRPYRTILARFSNTVDEVLDLTVHGEVARSVLSTAVQHLRANQQRTHEEALLAYLQRKSASLGLEQVAVLVYSNGLCTGQPTAGKGCPSLHALGTAIPVQGLTMYVLRFPAPLAPPVLPTGLDSERTRFQAIEARLASIADLTHGIAQRLDTPPPPPAPVLITLALPPLQVQPEAAGAVAQIPAQETNMTPDTPVSQEESLTSTPPAPPPEPSATPGAPSQAVSTEDSSPVPVAPPPTVPVEEPPAPGPTPDEPLVTAPPDTALAPDNAPTFAAPAPPHAPEGKAPYTLPWFPLLGLGAGLGVSLWGLRRWHRRFHPVLLIVSLDGVRYETPVETVPTELVLGPTLGCDILLADLPAPCHLHITPRQLVLQVAPAWHLSYGDTRQAAMSEDEGASSFTLTCGRLYRLTTPRGDHWLVVEQDALQATPDTEPTDDLQTPSQLSLLGLQEGNTPWQP